MASPSSCEAVWFPSLPEVRAAGRSSTGWPNDGLLTHLSCYSSIAPWPVRNSRTVAACVGHRAILADAAPRLWAHTNPEPGELARLRCEHAVNLHIPRYDAVRLRRLKSFRGSAQGNGSSVPAHSLLRKRRRSRNPRTVSERNAYSYDAVRLRRLKSFQGSAPGNGHLPTGRGLGEAPGGQVYVPASQLVWADACHGRIDSPCPAPCGG